MDFRRDGFSDGGIFGGTDGRIFGLGDKAKGYEHIVENSFMPDTFKKQNKILLLQIKTTRFNTQ